MKIESNCLVRLNYSIKLTNGEEVEANPPDQPLEFVTGREEVIPCLEREIMGMDAGERKSFEVGPEDGFGPRDPEALRRVSRCDLVDHGNELEEGMMFRLKDEEGNNLVITVLAVEGEEVVFDLNHPLAGMPLSFAVEILAVNAAPAA
jgi:FKBP-type peptidyl-prolyl cis-trans isomerase 2